ncbi:MAG: SBBP repeat-containing protein [Acidobacteria bacterium]|nr:SBBP repeat-containing protein [Acidobacteriota bacterium]
MRTVRLQAIRFFTLTLAIISLMFTQPTLLTRSAAATNGKTSSPEIKKNATKAGKAKAIENYGKLPLSFEPNQGQADPAVQFLSRGNSYTLFLTGNEAVMALRGSEKQNGFLKLQLVGANAAPQVEGRDPLEGKSNYLLGNDKSKWHVDIPTFGKVRQGEVWPGVDMVWYGNQRTLEYDFIVKPGVDPEQIKLMFEGAQKLRLDAAGNLTLKTQAGELTQKAPVVYQDTEQGRKIIAGKYLLKSHNEVGFEIGDYDASRPLVIDPQLLYSSFAGGSSTDEVSAVAADALGNSYLVGTTFSTNIPVKGAFQSQINGTDSDVFILKLNANGTNSVYCTYLGSHNQDLGRDIALMSNGQVCLTGTTKTLGTADFPTTSNAYQGNGTFASCLLSFCRGNDAFVTVLNAAGNGLVYSSYYGGSSFGFSNFDNGKSIAVDNTGRIFIAGATVSTNLPVKNGFQKSLSTFALADVFIAVFDPAKSGNDSLLYSSYLGGSGVDAAIDDLTVDIATDNVGNAYLAGTTFSDDLATKAPAGQSLPPLQAGFQGGGTDGFVAKIDTEASGASSLTYLTYFGGNGFDRVDAITVDSQQRVYITGETSSAAVTFPLKNAFRSTQVGTEAFVAKMNADGTALFYCSYIGGDGSDIGRDIAVDSAGNAYVTGFTNSGASFLSVNPLSANLAGTVFLAKIEASVSATTTPKLLYSTTFGGDSTSVRGIALDATGNLYVAGSTNGNLITTPGVFQPTFRGGSSDGFVAKFSSTFPDTIGVFRPSTNQFFLRNSNDSGAANITLGFGQAGDIPVAGDWDGDGDDEPGVFRPSTGQFILRKNTNSLFCNFPFTCTTTLFFGQAGDLPIVGDWNGDGIDTVGVYRVINGNGTWLLSNSPNVDNTSPQVNVSQFVFGLAGQLPVAGDWNGDGIDTVGVFQGGGQFAITNQLLNFDPAEAVFFIVQGGVGLHLSGDWDGDGVDTMGFFNNGTVQLRNSNSTGPANLSFNFGVAGDLPLAGDWNRSPLGGTSIF